MKPPANLVEQIEKLWNGVTIADLRREAVKQFNGTAFQAIRAENGRRFFLVCCVTGEHEQSKARKALGTASPVVLPKWEETSLFEGVARAIMAGGFIYAFDRDCPDPIKPMVLISGDPDSTTTLAGMLGIAD